MKILRLPVFSFVIAKGIKMETKNETKWNQIMKMNIFFQLLISDRLKSFSKEFSFCSFKGRDFCDSSSCCKIIKTKYIIIKYLCKSFNYQVVEMVRTFKYYLVIVGNCIFFIYLPIFIYFFDEIKSILFDITFSLLGTIFSILKKYSNAI